MQQENLSIYNSPLLFLKNFANLIWKDSYKFVTNNKSKLLTLFIFVIFYKSLHYFQFCSSLISEVDEILLFAGFWIGLGILSSVGLGTGLHTFILYLGPKIVKLVLASNQCKSIVKMRPSRFSLFPTFECPLPDDPDNKPVNFLTLFLAINLEAVLWGFGTALGELPPYYISRAARLAGNKNEELEEIKSQGNESVFGKIKLVIFRQVHQNSFLTVFLLASFPNPLFDLAGITCGHLLVPFWTFLGATILGKALIKVNLQVVFFIFMFSKNQIEFLKDLIKRIFNERISTWITIFLEEQQRGILGKLGNEEKGSGWIGILWNVLLFLMLFYFLCSIVDSRVRDHLEKKQ